MKRISLLLLLVVLAAGSVWAQNKVLSLDGDRDYVEVEQVFEYFRTYYNASLGKVQGFGWTNYFKETKLSAFSI